MATATLPNPTASPPVRRYRLLAGGHTQNDPDGTQRHYSAGDVVPSATWDLEKKFGSDKFSLIDRDGPERVIEKVVKKFVDFDEMTAEELREHAEAEEIELPAGCDTKQKMVAAIRAARRRSAS